MILHTTSRGLLAATLLFFLNGCFEIRQQLTVFEGGDAELMLTVGLDEELADLGEDINLDDEDCEGDFGFDDAELPPTLTRTKNVRVDEGDVLCDMMITGPLVDMMTALDDYNEQDGDDDFIMIQQLDDTQFALIGQYDFSDAGIDIDEDASAFELAVKRTVLAALANAQITWQVDVPHVVETNGEVLGNGTVVWGFSLSDAINESDVNTFEVVFDTESKSRFF